MERDNDNNNTNDDIYIYAICAVYYTIFCCAEVGMIRFVVVKGGAGCLAIRDGNQGQ